MEQIRSVVIRCEVDTNKHTYRYKGESVKDLVAFLRDWEVGDDLGFTDEDVEILRQIAPFVVGSTIAQPDLRAWAHGLADRLEALSIRDLDEDERRVEVE